MTSTTATSLGSLLLPRFGTDRRPIPWMAFLFLFVIFLLSQHDIARPVETGSTIDAPQEALLERVATGNSLRQLAFLLLAVFGIFNLIRRRGTKLNVGSPLSWLVLMLGAWTLASVVWSQVPVLTGKRLVVFVAMCLGAAAVVTQFSIKDLNLWIVLSSSLYLLLGIGTEISLGVFQPGFSGQRFAGTMHPNYQGVNCGLLTLCGVASATSAVNGRIFLYTSSLLGVIFLILTQSRTAFVSTCSALVLFWFLSLGTNKRLAFISVLLMVGCLLLLSIDTTEPILREVVHLGREAADSSRVPIWIDSLSYLEQRSLIGFGYGGFWTRQRIDDISEINHWGVGEAHSIYLTILLDLGLIGAVLFALMLFGSLASALKRFRFTRNPDYALLVALLVFAMLHGVLESSGALSTFQSFVTMVTVSFVAFVSPQHTHHGEMLAQ